VAQGAGPEFKPRNCKKIQVIIHLFMEMSQWNNLYSYLKQTKMSFFFFQKQRAGKQNRCCLGAGWLVALGEGRIQGKGCEGECDGNTLYSCMKKQTWGL
jgi:hypothetical protein